MRDLDPSTVLDFSVAMADYGASVAELLLADGFPVEASLTDGPLDDLEACSRGAADADGQVRLSFPPEVGERFGGFDPLGGMTDLVLGWSALSSWYIAGQDAAGYSVHRWLGAGLTPATSAVVNFFATAAVDLCAAGSEDRPYYRAPGVDLPGLTIRLNAASDPDVRIGYTSMATRRLEACWGHILRDLPDRPGESVTTVAVPAGELRALGRLVDFAVDVGGDHDHLRSFARLLVQDWKARAAGAGQQPAVPGARLAREYVERNAF